VEDEGLALKAVLERGLRAPAAVGAKTGEHKREGAMNAPVKLALVLAAAMSLTSGPVSAQPAEIAAGPYGGCPAGYHPGPYHRRCYINAGYYAPRYSVSPGFFGGCPRDFHKGPWGQRCFPNGAQEWIPAGPMGGCPEGYRPGPEHARCYPY
jgi:hypothetical protein